MCSRIVLTDVFYQKEYAQAAGLVIHKWTDALPSEEYLSASTDIEEYVSGQFYQRELPHLIRLLGMIVSYDCVVVDAHVWLEPNQPGAGHYLWQALDQRCPVIGVAKNPYRNGVALPLKRGESGKPLWISSVGVDVSQALSWIGEMSGPHRMPTLLKQVDSLSRQTPRPL